MVLCGCEGRHFGKFVFGLPTAEGMLLMKLRCSSSVSLVRKPVYNEKIGCD